MIPLLVQPISNEESTNILPVPWIRFLRCRFHGIDRLVIATMPATGRQRTIAVGIVILLIVAAVVIAPFASIQLAQIDAFIPVLQTVLRVVDFLTPTLLFASF